MWGGTTTISVIGTPTTFIIILFMYRSCYSFLKDSMSIINLIRFIKNSLNFQTSTIILEPISIKSGKIEDVQVVVFRQEQATLYG